MSEAPAGRDKAVLPDDLLRARVVDLLDTVAAASRVPGGGSVAAIVVALAAALVAMAGRLSHGDWDEAGGAIAQAEALRARVGPLAQVDAAALADAIGALRAIGAVDQERRDHELGSALARAAAVPLLIAEAAADVAALARVVAEEGNPEVRGDVAAAAALAEAAARAAAYLVEINLGATEADARVVAARDLAARAHSSAQAALAAGG